MLGQAKKRINEGLWEIAGRIQGDSASNFVWGEVKLPDVLKEEMEKEYFKKRKQGDERGL